MLTIWPARSRGVSDASVRSTQSRCASVRGVRGSSAPKAARDDALPAEDWLATPQPERRATARTSRGVVRINDVGKRSGSGGGEPHVDDERAVVRHARLDDPRTGAADVAGDEQVVDALRRRIHGIGEAVAGGARGP